MEVGKVSIIITTYKATERLNTAIESVLFQTYTNFELCIVDDNNPETYDRQYTESLIQKYSDKRIKYIKHDRNKKGAAARNTGIFHTDGEYVAFLDDDDYFYPKRLEACINALKRHDDYDMVYTSVELAQNDKIFEVRNAEKSGNIWRELLLNQGLLGTGSNIFIKRKCLESVGGFDETFLRYQDIEFMLRILERFRIFALNEVLVRKNIQETNIPPYEKYRENKQKIFSKFDYLISQLSEEEKEQYYRGHFHELLNCALESRNKEYIQSAIQDYHMNGLALSWKETLKIHFYNFYKKYLKLSVILRTNKVIKH